MVANSSASVGEDHQQLEQEHHEDQQDNQDEELLLVENNDENIGNRTAPKPKDEKFVKSIFLLLGIGFLLPWNAFISAAEYFETRVCLSEDNNNNASSFGEITDDTTPEDLTNGGSGSNFMLWFGLIFNLSGLVTLSFMLISQRRTENKVRGSDSITENGESIITQSLLNQNESGERIMGESGDNNSNSRKTSGRKRIWKMIVVSFCCFLITMMLTTSLVLVPSINPSFFRLLSLTSAGICGTAGAFTSAGIVSFASIFPPNIGIQPYIAGQAVGGVVISILNLVLSSMGDTGADAFWDQHCAKNSYSDDVDIDIFLHDMEWIKSTPNSQTSCSEYRIDWGAFSYFLIGCIFIALCIGLYLHLDQHSVTEYYRNLEVEPTRQAVSTEETTPIINPEENSLMELNLGQDTRSLNEPLLSNEERSEEQQVCSVDTNEEAGQNSPTVTGKAWQCIKKPVISIFVTFFVTITIFPSWVTKLQSVQQCLDEKSRFRNDLFFPALIALFNIFDLIGRTASGYVDIRGQNPRSFDKKLAAASYARFIFFPLFLLVKASGSILAPPIKIFFHDGFPVIFTILFAFTNGFVSCLSFIQASTSTPQSEDVQQIASTILNLAVGGGLFSGSLFSFFYNFFGTGKWS